MKNRVLIIGLDGATFKLIKPWVKEGKLPTFAKLMEEGIYGELESTPEMISPAAWTSFSTGNNPGKHGIYDFLSLIPGTLKTQYLNSTHRGGKPVWAILSEAGKMVGVLNVPMTYPADRVNGFMLSGWNAPTVNSPGFSHPTNLIMELTKKFGDIPLFPAVKKYMAIGRPDLGLKELYGYLDKHAEVTKHLLKTHPWDFLVAFFIATDQVQHYYWHYMDDQHPQFQTEEAKKYGDAIFSIYKRCDQIIAELIEDLPEDTTVIVMSDHGSGRNHGAVQFLPTWLKEMGLAREMVGASKSGLAMQWVRMKYFLKIMLKEVYNFLNNYLSIKAKSYLNIYFAALRDKVESTWRFSAYDWQNTKVFFHYEPRINLKGREPYGIVSPGKEYEDLRNHLIEKLCECKDVKTGQHVVEKVFKGDEVYHGIHISNAPDIIIRWKEGIVLSGLTCKRDDGEEIRVTNKYVEDLRTGNHMPAGIFIAKGKNIKSAGEIFGASIMDLAPTVLYLMGEAVPNDMDGKVLVNIFTDHYLEQNEISFTKAKGDKDDDNGGYSRTDEEIVRKHLRDLGYLN